MADAFALAVVVAQMGMESRRRRIRENDLLLDAVLKYPEEMAGELEMMIRLLNKKKGNSRRVGKTSMSMNVEKAIQEKVRNLPDEQQEQVLEFVENLRQNIP